jgi:ectoine hydroxylase-related dioxygenase (phytanoyl-CoA dioxygenase family)
LFKKAVTVLVFLKNLLAAITPVHEVVNGARILYAQFSRHAAPDDERRAIVSIVMTDPFSTFPYVHLLQQMITVRRHLDARDETNGAVRVIPGSHRLGLLSADTIQRFRFKSLPPCAALPLKAPC